MTSIKAALQHTTDTKELIIGPGFASRTGEVFAKLFPGAKAAIIADTNTFAVAGEVVMDSLSSSGIAFEPPFIIDDPELYAEWKYVEMLQEYLRNLEVIAITVGSGVLNDLVKYVSHTLGRKYMCVGTAASMDGYTAFGSSITMDGNKQAFGCPAPYGFVMDTKVAAQAPKELAASGYADLIAKIPAGADWIFADAAGVEAIDPFAWSFVQDDLRYELSQPEAIFAGEIEPTAALSEGLLLSGFAMQAFQSSRPASGAEHQFSHCWDMENLCHEGRHVSHGFKVGIGTLTSVASCEFLLKTDIRAIDVEKCVAAWPSWEEMEGRIHAMFDGEIPALLERGLKETKAKYVGPEEIRRELLALQAAWPEVCEKVRAQIMPFEEVRAKLKAVGAPTTPEEIGVSRQRLRKTLRFIPYMRSRFNNFDVVYRFGLMEALEADLFGPDGVWGV